jgi:hypothetical protein
LWVLPNTTMGLLLRWRWLGLRLSRCIRGLVQLCFTVSAPMGRFRGARTSTTRLAPLLRLPSLDPISWKCMKAIPEPCSAWRGSFRNAWSTPIVKDAPSKFGAVGQQHASRCHAHFSQWRSLKPFSMFHGQRQITPQDLHESEGLAQSEGLAHYEARATGLLQMDSVTRLRVRWCSRCRKQQPGPRRMGNADYSASPASVSFPLTVN